MSNSQQAEWSAARKLADFILRQVVCCCGNYRHHGVDWMPEGSGEGVNEAVEAIERFLDLAVTEAFASARALANPLKYSQWVRIDGHRLPFLTGPWMYWSLEVIIELQCSDDLSAMAWYAETH